MNLPFTIAHYKIAAKLGEGGMGAVYRATDTKLNREVAIKVLPDALANDPDYLARFTREAQVLASLNHPNIAIIHGVEDRALVMELVPGTTLEEKIAAGPIPLEEVLGIAAQIADALEAAHEKGVIHRDLKPANVKVTPEGVVKVLDFGLAKAADAVPAAATGNSPTVTIRATQAGLIMGTPAYMAPEQAAGKPVDRRADVWSFGVLLYELLTGKRVFIGEKVSDTLAAVLKDQIDFELPRVPPSIRRLLARCLNRNAKERLRDIGEARIAIRQYLANPAAGNEPGTSERAGGEPNQDRGLGYWLPRASCVVLFLALTAALAWIFKPSPPLRITRFPVTLGPGQVLTNTNRLSLAISPDGTQMAYVADRQLYLRSMAELDARPIAGTSTGETVSNPAFSPDGKHLAFFTGSSTLKRVAVSGGTPVAICAGLTPAGLSWGDDGILFGVFGKGIMRVSPKGGQPEVLIVAKENEIMSEPQMLPGGEAILFTLGERKSRGGGWDKAQLVAQTLKSGTRKTLAQGALIGRFLPTGHLIYCANGVLFGVPFNPRRLEKTGNPVGLVEGVAGGAGTAQFAYSSLGTLIYLPGTVITSGAGESVLARVDRKGDSESLKVPFAAYGYPRASKDGKRVAYHIDAGAESGIWVLELAESTAPRRLTLPGKGANRYPIWCSDGQRIAFQSDREGDHGIWWQRADGSGAPEHLTIPGKGIAHIPDSCSRDGETLLFTEEKDKISEVWPPANGYPPSSVWTYSLRNKKATQFAAVSGEALGRSAFSPDGHWVAYQSGGAQHDSRIYVRPFPLTSTAYVAPIDGDPHHPVWSPDGKELFFVSGFSQMGSISISTKPSVSFGNPVSPLRSGFNTATPAGVRTFDVLPDGKHFIGVVPAGQISSGDGESQIQVVLNWFEDLKRRVPRE